LFAVIFCTAGYGIRKKRRYGAWSSLIAVSLNTYFLFSIHFPISFLGLIIGFFILFGVIKNWKSFV
jgi:hypothetical protein